MLDAEVAAVDLGFALLLCVSWFHDLGSSISLHAHSALSYLWLPCQDSKLAAAPCSTREHSDLDFVFLVQNESRVGVYSN